MLDTAIEDAPIGGFRRDGCAVLRGVLTSWIEGTREASKQNIESPGFRERTCRPDDGNAFSFRACSGLAHEHGAPFGGPEFPILRPVGQRPAG